MNRENLEGGKLLKALIALYRESQESVNYTSVLICLRDSNVWVCGNAELAGDDSADGTIDSIGGYSFTPEILQSEDGCLFLPVFSSLDEISDEYRELYSVIEKPFLEVLDIAGQNEAIYAVAIDPFSSPFVVTSDIYSLISGLESSLED